MPSATYPKAKEINPFAPKKKGEKSGGIGYEDLEKPPELSTLTSWRQYASDKDKRKHWEWFVIDQYLRGNHNVRGNPNDNSIVVTQRSEGINYPINKMFSTFRAVRSFVTRHKPFVEVEPEDSEEATIAYARRANQILERDNKLNNFRRINKEWVYYGVKYGIGWRQIGYNLEKKCAIRWTIDPFDFLVGAKTGKAEDAPYVIKDLIRSVGYLSNRYPSVEAKDAIVPDNKVAADEYKELAMQINSPEVYSQMQNLNEQTVTCHEAWYRLYKPNSLGGYVNKCLFTKAGIIDFEETPYNEFPFIPYESDIMPNELYPEGHMKHILSPQRMLNMLETQLLEYNHIVNRGRFVTEKNSGFQAIYGKEGQIIRVNQGKRLQVLNPPAINPALPEQIRHANDYIEDIGGQHDASQGVRPSGITAGKAIEALQQGDSNSISDLRDNFEDALQKEAAWILKVYSLFEKDGVVIEEEIDNEGEVEKKKFAAMGEEAIKRAGGKKPSRFYIEGSGEANGSYCDVCAILPDNQVKVSVQSEFGETKEARQELLFRLLESGVPLKIVLKYLEFPGADDVMQRVADETVADMEMEMMKAQMGAVPGSMPPPGGSIPPVEVPPPPPAVDLDLISSELEGV